jgi:hypothetical protein
MEFLGKIIEKINEYQLEIVLNGTLQPRVSFQLNLCMLII